MNEQIRVGKIIFWLFFVGAIVALLVGLSNVSYSLGQLEKLGLTFFEGLGSSESQVPQTLFILLLCPLLIGVGAVINRMIPSTVSLGRETVRIALWYVFYIGFSYFLGLTIYYGLYFFVGVLTFPISLISLSIGFAFFEPPRRVLLWYSVLPSVLILGGLLVYTILNPLVG